MRPLYPSLPEIQSSLFRPSDALLMRIATGDSTVPDALRRAVESDNESMSLIAELRASALTPKHTPSGDSPTAGAMPAYIADLIHRRVARVAGQYANVPTAGQILSVQDVIGPKGDLGWDLSRPLAVLIEAPAMSEDGSESHNVWYGWMVSPETDYATHWDFVLSVEDEPFDPLAGMVQVWNPVYVYLKSTRTVLAELRPARLQAVRALADEYLTAEDPDPAWARPGFVALRQTLGGMRVLTGTPLSGSDDPRWCYQELYYAVAEAIRLPARLAQEPANSLLTWLSGLLSRGLENTIGITPNIRELQPMLAPATLGDRTDSPIPVAYQLEGILELRVSHEDEQLVLSMKLLRDEPVRIILIENGQEKALKLLTPEWRDDHLTLAKNHEYSLRVMDLDERNIYTVEPE